MFHPRCPYFVAGLCDEVVPPLVADVGDDREVACHVVVREHGAGGGGGKDVAA